MSRSTELVVKYEHSETDLVAAVAESRGLKIEGPEDRKGYAAVHAQRMKLKGYRTAIEAQRKELKADALEWGRRVDAEAKRLTAIVEPMELELEAAQRAIDAERERIKAEAEAAKRAKLDGRVAAFSLLGVQVAPSAVQEFSDEEYESALGVARIEYEARVERERLEAEQKAREEAAAQAAIEAQRRADEEARRVERERIARERAELERIRAEQAAAQKRLDDEAARVREEQRAAQARLDAERAAFEAERVRAERERVAKAEAEDRAREQAQLEALEARSFPQVSEAGPVGLDAVRSEVLAECDEEDEREAVECALSVYVALDWDGGVQRNRVLLACADRTSSSEGDERLAYMALGYLAGMRDERARKVEGS